MTEVAGPFSGGTASGEESRRSSFSRQGMDSKPGGSGLEGLCMLIGSSIVGELEDRASGFRDKSRFSDVTPHSGSSVAFWSSAIFRGLARWAGSLEQELLGVLRVPDLEINILQ